ncbi:MAG: hypothetical protein EOP35_00530 [Rubrivivax sp.]|nr:MAG: hypothetical protein EOP35_00530 [Rubrivivax sp.]
MSHFHVPLLRLGAAALLALLQAGAQAETVPFPDGFNITPSKRLERLHYAERTGELPNTVSRPTLEQVCRTQRELGGNARSPVFEAGYDQPARTRTHVYFSPDGLRRAAYTELTAYNCEAAEFKANGPCGCTYRPLVRHSVEISVWQAGRFQRWRADLEEGKGTLEEDSAAAQAKLAEPDDATLTRLFGPVVGKASAAGFACAQREQPAARTPWRTCLALPDPKLPKLLWGRVMSSSAGEPDSPVRQSSELTRLVLEADVDPAVFTPPTGITYRSRRASNKEFQL